MSRSLASSQGMEACGGFAGPSAFQATSSSHFGEEWGRSPTCRWSLDILEDQS